MQCNPAETVEAKRQRTRDSKQQLTGKKQRHSRSRTWAAALACLAATQKDAGCLAAWLLATDWTQFWTISLLAESVQLLSCWLMLDHPFMQFYYRKACQFNAHCFAAVA